MYNEARRALIRAAGEFVVSPRVETMIDRPSRSISHSHTLRSLLTATANDVICFITCSFCQAYIHGRPWRNRDVRLLSSRWIHACRCVPAGCYTARGELIVMIVRFAYYVCIQVIRDLFRSLHRYMRLLKCILSCGM